MVEVIATSIFIKTVTTTIGPNAEAQFSLRMKARISLKLRLLLWRIYVLNLYSTVRALTHLLTERSHAPT